MTVGLVLEGGGMRGLFTAGVIDVLLENKIHIDTTIGVSAGAVFGMNFKSGQIGRVLRFNLKYCQDPRYMSVRSLIKTGDIYGADFCYNQLTYHLDPFDYREFGRSPMKFYVVCTDLNSGKAVYHLCPNGTPDDMIWMRASASMPMVSRNVEIDGNVYLDGGVADPIPIRFAESLGFDKIIIVRTRPADEIYEPQAGMWYARRIYRKYPAFIKIFAERHILYQEQATYINNLEKNGKIFVIQPNKTLDVRVNENIPEKLQNVYDIGRSEATINIESLKEYLR